MSKFKNLKTGAVVSVADEKDDRFDEEWEKVEKPKPAAKKTAAK